MRGEEPCEVPFWICVVSHTLWNVKRMKIGQNAQQTVRRMQRRAFVTLWRQTKNATSRNRGLEQGQGPETPISGPYSGEIREQPDPA